MSCSWADALVLAGIGLVLLIITYAIWDSHNVTINVTIEECGQGTAHTTTILMQHWIGKSLVFTPIITTRYTIEFGDISDYKFCNQNGSQICCYR
jgi:hypothetical protein